jgi:hypothetical protein
MTSVLHAEFFAEVKAAFATGANIARQQAMQHLFVQLLGREGRNPTFRASAIYSGRGVNHGLREDPEIYRFH